MQRHCHHYAVMGFHAGRWLLDRLGVDAEILDSGCCGLADSFGFEAGQKYEVSKAAGERVLLDAALNRRSESASGSRWDGVR